MSDQGASWPEPLRWDVCLDLIVKMLDRADASPRSFGLEWLADEPRHRRVELLGCAVWDVFSRNHRVLDPDGRPCELGSFRACAGFIADAVNGRESDPERRYGNLDFYMGASLRDERERLPPVYRWIFAFLRERGYDWRYPFPRLYLLQLSPEAVADDDPDEPAFLSYDPADTVRSELEEKEQDEKLGSLRKEIERRNEEAIREARHNPLPPVVAAYRAVYGRLPDGWPHQDM